MGDKTVSVRVRFEGGDQVKAGLQEVGREGTRALQSIGTVSAQTGAKLQNAGYQVSDFFVQIAGGTAPSRALAQQMPQLLQGFGLIGVAASVAIAALPSLWALFGMGGDEAKALQKELDGLGKATDAYGRAADLAIEPMDRLIKKYGEYANAVRQARAEQADLARGEAMRALNGVLSNTAEATGNTGTSSAQIAQALAVEQAYKRIRDLQNSLTPEQARAFDFTADLADIDRMASGVADVRAGIAGMATEFGITFEQAASVAVAIDRVRDSAGQGAAEQIAAASALRDYLVEVYGSADAANQATGGLVERLNAAITAAADVASAAGAIAGAIGAGADEAARLASNLAIAAAQQRIADQGKVYGAVGARGDPRNSNAQGYGTFKYNGPNLDQFNNPIAKKGGGGGGGGADKDLARAAALTDSVRTATEKYAIALAEIDRLKSKGLITDEVYNRQLDKLKDGLGALGDLGKKAAGAIRGAFDNLFDDPAAALKNLSKQLAQMALYAGLSKAFPSVFGGGGFVDLGIKGFAAGGRHGGGLRIVGENGPELEATGPSTIYPADVLRSMGRGGNGGANVQIINNTGQPARTETSRGPNGEELVRVLVGEEIARGGLDKPMRGRFGATPQRMKR